MPESTPPIEDHIHDISPATSSLRAEHESETARLQRIVDRLTALAGHPRSVSVITAVIVSWIGANLAAPALKLQPLDPPPFLWLQGVVATASLYIAVLILTTQRRQAQLTNNRTDLTLEIGILAEQKSAKIIELLEEMRRDNPMIANRLDSEAQAMAAPTDHYSVLSAVKRDSTRADDAAAPPHC